MTSSSAAVPLAALSLVCLVSASVALTSVALAAPITPLVRKACGEDYRKYCGDYGLGTEALRICMNKAGHSLSNSCVSALIRAGEVSQAEVDQRKRAGH
jgi:hypothetical protein